MDDIVERLRASAKVGGPGLSTAECAEAADEIERLRSHRSDDGSRPHRWPGLPADGDPECIAWKCAVCGEWVSEYEPSTPDDCPIDWRNGEAS